MSDTAAAYVQMKMSQETVAHTDKKPEASGISTNVDNGKKEPCCKECQKLVDDLLSNYDTEMKGLQDRYDRLYGRYQDKERSFQDLQERSDSITSHMADIMETKSDLENNTDEYANIPLGKKFEQLYTTEWCDLSEWLEENTNLSELDRIKTVTKVSKEAYYLCEKVAEEQIRHFLFLDSEDEIPDSEKEPSLYKERRVLGKQKKVRTQVQKRVIDKVVTEDLLANLSPESEKEILPDLKDKLEKFLEKYIDFCWLFIITHPRLYFEFEVIDKKYADIKEQFKTYSCQDKVVDETKEKGSVYCVVWPSVIYKDDSVLMKGDVVIVD
ncbi:hypothetical protein ACF0H5_014786 [Mactra antiquata]